MDIEVMNYEDFKKLDKSRQASLISLWIAQELTDKEIYTEMGITFEEYHNLLVDLGIKQGIKYSDLHPTEPTKKSEKIIETQNAVVEKEDGSIEIVEVADDYLEDDIEYNSIVSVNDDTEKKLSIENNNTVLGHDICLDVKFAATSDNAKVMLENFISMLDKNANYSFQLKIKENKQ